VLKDRDANDGLTDIMTRAEDASKINRIFERFGLASIDMGSVKTEIEQSREKDVPASSEDIPVPERNDRVKDKVDEFLDAVIQEKIPLQRHSKRETPPWPGLRSPVSPSLPTRPEQSPAGYP
jgi:hypothetical protein